jgi:hypothetical protein
MLKRLVTIALLLLVGTAIYAQDSEICERDAVIQAFAEADDLRAWAAEYAECPPNVRRAVDTLAAASDLLQSEFLVFASAGDGFSFSPIWKFYQGSSASRVFGIDVTTNTLTLFGDSNTEQSGNTTTAPVLAYEYEGDFTARVILNYSSVSPLHGTGFGVRAGDNANEWIRLTRVDDELQFVVNEGGEASVEKSLSYTGGDNVYLQIGRTGDRFTLSYSIDGDSWDVLAEDFNFALPQTVEIFVTTFFGEPTGAGSGTFSEFKVE